MGVHDADYSKIKAALGIPEDEPIFVLRAQDKLSVPTISRYKNHALQIEVTDQRPSDEWFEQMDGVLTEFANWQREHRDLVKVPD